jgi:hypothetical protein
LEMESHDDEDEKPTPTEIKMMYILNQRKEEVVIELVKGITRSNDDLETCLNSNMILLEMSDNEVSYPFVGDPIILS